MPPPHKKDEQPESATYQLHAPEFEEAIKFNMDAGQREAHASKMEAEAFQMKANARKTIAEAKELENKNWKNQVWIGGIYTMSTLCIFAVGLLFGLIIERHADLVPW